MLQKHFKGIFVVHEKEVFWLSNHGSGENPKIVSYPFDRFIASQGIVDDLPRQGKADNNVLCIVPDHWFGMETYPFQVKKKALIELFLLRKLATAFPDRPEMRDFFTYQWSAASNEVDRLMMYYLQERSAYDFCSVLGSLRLSPRLVTTPAFLWKARLAELCPDFSQQGSLFIHIYGHECSLYFFSKGNYSFSRNVALPETEERIETLRFEINQSLYMFSQKTKSEVGGYFVLADDSIRPTELGNALGRKLVDIKPEIMATMSPAYARIPLMNGLFPPKGLVYSPLVIGVAHRGVKRDLEWEPAQRVGVVLGSLLCSAFFWESTYLHSDIQGQNLENLTLERQLQEVATFSLSDYETAVDHVLRVSDRVSSESIIRRLLTNLPSLVSIQEMTFMSEQQSTLAIRARVEVLTTEELRQVLIRLVAHVKTKFTQASAFSINDIEIQWDPQGEGKTSSRYSISFKVTVS